MLDNQIRNSINFFVNIGGKILLDAQYAGNSRSPDHMLIF